MDYYAIWGQCIKQAQEDVEAYEQARIFYSILKEMAHYNPDNATLLAGIDCYASKEEEEADL